MDSLHFQLITLDGVKFEDTVYEAILPTETGQIAVLPGHAPLLTLATVGVISIRHKKGDTDATLDHFASGGGVIEITPQAIRFLADTAEHADAIDELRAKEALAKAKALQKSAGDHVTLADATALIERNTVRLKVAELRRRKHKT